MTLAEAIQKKIKDAGVKSVFVIDSPAKDNTIIVVPYNGESISGIRAGWQSFQIRAAADTYPASESLAWQAYRALVDKKLDAADRTPIGSVVDLQEPFFLEQDEQNRYVHVFNIMAPAKWKGE